MNDQLQDRAQEWVNEHYPNASDTEWHELIKQTMLELAELDVAADLKEQA